jgi:DNA-binding beta-propeller fold protein YncE
VLVDVPSKNLVAVVDLTAMKVVKNLDVPAAPQAVLVRPDGKEAYSSCDKSHKIAVINVADWTVKGTIDAGPGADGLAWAK